MKQGIATQHLEKTTEQAGRLTVRRRFLFSQGILVSLLLVFGGCVLWTLKVIEEESLKNEKIYFPNLLASQRIAEDAAAIASYASHMAHRISVSEQVGLLSRIDSRSESIERQLAALEQDHGDAATVAGLRGAVADLTGSAARIRTLSRDRDAAALTIERTLSAVRQGVGAAAGSGAGGAEAATDPRRAALLVLIATAPSRLVLNQLGLELAALAPSPDPAGDADLLNARQTLLDLERRIENLGRMQWELTARMMAMASSLAAEARQWQENQNRLISGLTARLAVLLAAAFVSGLAAAVLLSRWLGRSVVTPLSQLAEATRRIAGGELDVAIPHPPARSEVADLADALAVFRDATRQVHDQRDALAWRTVALDAAGDAFVIFDSVGRIDYVNPAFARLTGYGAQDVLGTSIGGVLSTSDADEALTAMRETVRAGGVWSGDLTSRHRDGTLYTQSATVAPVCGDDGQPVRFVAVMRDVTAVKQRQQELQWLAATDALTGLPNRRHMVETVERELERTRCHRLPLSLLVLDIDHFKVVNDTYGHAAGDAVLRALADTCRGLLRGMDVPARMGGEEFVILLPQTPIPGAVEVAERLRRAVAAMEVPLDGGGTVTITVSIGIAGIDGATEDGGAADEDGSPVSGFDRLMALADQALYRAKGEGRNRVRLCGPRGAA